MKKRILWIDLLKFIGLIGVLLMHIIGNTINTYGGLKVNANNIYIYLALFFEFVIPLFVMISGMMLLSKENLSYKYIFKKYILKIILIIVIIGSSMILLEELFINKTLSINLINKLITRLITGDIWTHMWYLYLLLGLYLLTPIFNIITNNIEQKNYKILLIILFAISILLPHIENLINLKTPLNYLNISGFIFYYFYGHYLYKFNISKKYKIINYVLSFVSIIYLIFYIKEHASLNYLLSYTTFIPFIIASSIILLFKDKDIKSKFNNPINSIGECSLGIYVFHQFFINIIFKVLKIKFIINYPYLGLLLYLIIIFTLSYSFTYFIRKIKVVKNII